MKIKLDLNSEDLMALNNPETSAEVEAQAHDLLARIFEERDKLIKCSITMENKED